MWVEHLGDLAHRNGGRGLVHQDDLGIGEHGAGDGDGLSLTAGHLPDQIARAGFRLQFGEQFAGPLVHGAVVDDRERTDALADLPAQKDVLACRHVVAEREVLIDDLDAVAARIDRVRHRNSLPIDVDRAGGRRIVAGDHLHDRRLAGAIVAHQAHDLARLQRQRDVVHGVDGARNAWICS